VSATGERVFFTATAGGCEQTIEINGEAVTTVGAGPEVNELYARVGRAETIAISEPSFSQCTLCRTGTATPREPATTEKPSVFRGASEDGSKVFFTTEQELLPEQSTVNLYEYDFNRAAGEKIVLVSRGAKEPQVQGLMRVSENGSHVYFVAKSVLAGANGEGHSPVATADNLYVFEPDAGEGQGRMAFVAILSEGDFEAWQTQGNRPAQASPDGRFLVFESQTHIFEYDAREERLVNISGEHEAQIPRPKYEEVDSPTAAGSSLSVSNDGAYVAFTSSAQLTAQPVAGTSNVYEYHSSGSIAVGTTYLVSDGKDVTPEGQALEGIDATGADTFFQSGDSLVAQDTDTQVSLYDARTNGGFPAPVTSAGCEGEACQGAPLVLPSFGVPGSVSVQGAANVPPPPPPPPLGPVAKPTVKPLTQAQKLTKALKACRHKPKSKRPACERQARRAHGPARKATKSRNGGK
jgi:Tol biopolymer transport system component